MAYALLGFASTFSIDVVAVEPEECRELLSLALLMLSMLICSPDETRIRRGRL